MLCGPVEGTISQGDNSMRDSGPIPTRVRISTHDLPRWSAIRDHIRQELQSRPSIHQIKDPTDSRIVGEMLLIVAQQCRIPDPDIHYHDTEADITPDVFLASMQHTLELGNRALDMVDRLDAQFKNRFPDEYAASKAEDEDAV